MGLYTKYVESYPDIKKYWNESSGELRQVFGNSLEEFGKWHWQTHGKSENRSITGSTTLSSSQKVPSFGAASSTPSNQTYGPLTTQDQTQQDLGNQLSDLEDKLTTFETAIDEQLGDLQTTPAYDLTPILDKIGELQPSPTYDLTPILDKLGELQKTPAYDLTPLQDQLKIYQETVAGLPKTLLDSFDKQIETFQSTSAENQKKLLDVYKGEAAEERSLLKKQFDKQFGASQENARRQMLIGLQSKSKKPAPVRTAASTAQQQGLTTRGSTGYFGRQGLRIGALNVPTTGLTISSGGQPSKIMAPSTPGSFN